ncbi:hypothetical protein DY000_02003297 [Brassica cretica]|uniref:Protein kinase domain-containing protein n=1 Tax=Brassica cretica TaxID=69181 RepID=A0ABQ7CEY6_BRACR|nr:hypothetical protein DY000_02003297 [Brassica cretica]
MRVVMVTPPLAQSFGSVYDGNSGGGIITSWMKGDLLGRGSFGSVYEGISG